MSDNEGLKEIRICENCGKEYEVNGFNCFAPFSMCDTCYDNYLIDNFNKLEYDF